MNISVSLKEGMKLSLVENKNKVYTLIKSNKDSEFYLLFQREILKLSTIDEIDKKFICVDLDSFEDIIDVLVTKNDNYYIVNNDFCIQTFIEKELKNRINEFISLNVKIIKMTREEFMLKNSNDYYFRCRDIIAEKYSELKGSL